MIPALAANNKHTGVERFRVGNKLSLCHFENIAFNLFSLSVQLIQLLRFYKNNVELNLSEKERSLLLLFVRHPQQVFTKDMIYEQIWGNLIAVDDNAIMVYINRLRSKIEDNARTPQHIITIRGVGYRFVP